MKITTGIIKRVKELNDLINMDGIDQIPICIDNEGTWFHGGYMSEIIINSNSVSVRYLCVNKHKYVSELIISKKQFDYTTKHLRRSLKKRNNIIVTL